MKRKLGRLVALLAALAGCPAPQAPRDAGVDRAEPAESGVADGTGDAQGLCNPLCQAKAKNYCIYLGKNEAGGDSCVECTKDEHCAKNPYAFGTVCTSAGLCACASDTDCATSLRGALCDTTSNICYCKTSEDCTVGGYTLCDANQAACAKPCSADSDCTGAVNKYCNTLTQLCNSTKMCTSDAECTDKTLKYCNTKTKTCQATKPCSASADCTSSRLPICKVATGQCVECTANSECETSQNGELCSSNACTCSSDSDCKASSGYPWGGRCISSTGSTAKRCGCSSSSDCSNNPNGPTCYTTYTKCSCSADSDCADPTYTKCALPYRGAAYSNCQEPCTTDAECKARASELNTGLPTCSDGKCVECETASDCHGGMPVCSSSGACVQCEADGDCPPSRPFCDAAAFACYECKTSADCASATSGGKCDASTKSCTCASNSDCTSSKAFGPTCDTKVTKRCSCKASSDCAGNANGPTCNSSYSKCTCSSDSACTKAPYTKCNVPYPGGSYSLCQEPCTSAGGCDFTQGFYACDTSSGKCYECLTSSDCSFNTFAKVCDTTMAECVECTKDADCTTSSLGSKCNTTYNSCICESDADCTGNAFGKVCDTSSFVCSCATSSDCPSGELCTGDAVYYNYCE